MCLNKRLAVEVIPLVDSSHWCAFIMMTSPSRNIFRVTSLLCGEFTGHRHKGQWGRALMFSSICAWINSWVNNRDAGNLNRHRAHYDVSVMFPDAFSITGTLVRGLHLSGDFPHKGPVMRCFNVSFAFRLNKLFNMQFSYILVIPDSLRFWDAIDSSPLSAAYMCRWTGSALLQAMACRLFGAMSSPE